MPAHDSSPRSHAPAMADLEATVTGAIVEMKEAFTGNFPPRPPSPLHLQCDFFEFPPRTWECFARLERCSGNLAWHAITHAR